MKAFGFRRISELSRNYETPQDGCNTYRVTLNLLKESKMTSTGTSTWKTIFCSLLRRV